jgi:hypothetical protein
MGKFDLKSILIKIKNKITPEDPFKKGFTAKEANLETVYPMPIFDNNKRLANFYYKINKEINNRTLIKEFECTITIPIDLLEFKDDIIFHYNELGYKCFELRKISEVFPKHVIYIDWSSYKSENINESES